MYKIAIIGYGGIARVHVSSYAELEKNGKAKLVAVFDKYASSFEGKVDMNLGADKGTNIEFNKYTDLEEMLSKEDIDIIDICLPTHLHKDISIQMLRRGYHVLCEKPMATSYEDCMEMLDEAKKAGKRLMIGQCLHFFPDYEYLKEVVVDKRFGEVKSAFLQRLSSPPRWCKDGWNTKKENFGSCLHDLHIHDVDMCHYLFGTPKEVFCKTKDGFGQMDGVTSLLMYDNFTATIMGDWSLVNFPFHSEYRVAFERATIIGYDGVVTVYPTESEAFKPEISNLSGYTSEIDHFIDVASGERDHGKNHVRDAAETIKIITLLCECAEEGGVKKEYK